MKTSKSITKKVVTTTNLDCNLQIKDSIKIDCKLYRLYNLLFFYHFRLKKTNTLRTLFFY